MNIHVTRKNRQLGKVYWEPPNAHTPWALTKIQHHRLPPPGNRTYPGSRSRTWIKCWVSLCVHRCSCALIRSNPPRVGRVSCSPENQLSLLLQILLYLATSALSSMKPSSRPSSQIDFRSLGDEWRTRRESIRGTWILIRCSMRRYVGEDNFHRTDS